MTKEKLKSVNKSRQSKAGNFEPEPSETKAEFSAVNSIYI